MFIKEFCRLSSRRLSKRMPETVEHMRGVLNSEQRPGREVHESDAGTYVMEKRKFSGGGREYLVQDGVSLLFGQVWEAVERARPALQVERLLGMVLGELFNADWLACFVKCLRKWLYVYGVLVFDGNVRMVIAKSRFISKGFFLSIDEYYAAVDCTQSTAD